MESMEFASESKSIQHTSSSRSMHSHTSRWSRKASHASERTSTTASSLYLQGRSRESDHAEMTAFLNEEKLQTERIAARRIQRVLDNGRMLQVDRGIRGICFRLMHNDGMQVLCHMAALFTLLLVLVHANVAAGTLRDPEDVTLQAVSDAIDAVMKVLIGLYVLEVVLRVIGCPVQPFYLDGWLVTDVVVSSIAFTDEFLLEHFNSLGIFRSSRAIRMLRILRVGRIFSVFASIREYPLVAQVVAETVARLGWMLAIWSTVGWCTAVMLTVVVGASGYTELPPVEDPILQALVESGPTYPLSVEEILRGMGGSLLILNMIPLRLIYWGPGIVWKLLLAESLRWNVAGSIILAYAALCLCWLWPMVLGTFISALREGNAKHQQKKIAEARADSAMSAAELIELFEDIVGDNKERFISIDDFRDLQLRHPPFHHLISGGKTGKIADSLADVIFREIDVMGHNFLTLPDFVVGVLKIFRVSPRPEFMHTDEQQRRALKSFKKVSDSTRFSFLVTNRYISEFSHMLQTLLESSASMLRQVETPRTPQVEQRSLAAVDEKEDAAIRQWFRSMAEEDHKIMSRLDALEERIGNLQKRTYPVEEKLKTAFGKVTEKMIQEDVLPWLRSAIPQYCAGLSLKVQRRDEMQRTAAAGQTQVQQGQVHLQSPPSPDSQQRRGFRLMETLREAGGEFGRPTAPPKSDPARRS